MVQLDCLGAEALAGAIALREATDVERQAFRLHLTSCKRCVETIGGEHEIERIADSVAQARESERWEPALPKVTGKSASRLRRIPQWTGAVAAVAVIGLGIYTLAERAAEHPIVVVQNVVTLARPTAQEKRSIAALSTQITPKSEQQAESLKLESGSAAVRDVTPVGGEGALVPHPPAIAYQEGAEGTTAFGVLVDRHGKPLGCTIEKSSGYKALDDAVCHAAMQARYVPRTIDGHAVDAVYRDAFTFRSSN